MAGKKKKSGGKKRGGDGGSTEEPDPFAAPEVGALTLENADRDLAIARLKTSTAAYRDAGDLLEAHVDALRDAVARERRDERDISDHLGRELIARQADVKRLYAEVEARETLLREEEARLDDVVASRVKACDAVTLELEARRAALVEREAEIKERQRERSRILEGLKTISQSISDDAAPQRREAAAAARAARARRRRAPPRERRVRRGDQAPARGADERTARGDDARDGGGPRAQDARARSNDKNDGAPSRRERRRRRTRRDRASTRASRRRRSRRPNDAPGRSTRRRANFCAPGRDRGTASRREARARRKRQGVRRRRGGARGERGADRRFSRTSGRVERERDARRAEAARVRDAQGTRREDPARFVSRALARYVFLKRDALVAEDEDEDGGRRRVASRSERRRARREGAVRRVVRVRGVRRERRSRREGRAKPVSRSAPGRFESAAAARGGAVRPRRAPRDARDGRRVYAFGGVGGGTPRPKPKPKPKPNSKPKPNAAAKRAAREAPSRDGDRRRRRRLRRVPPRARPSRRAPPPEIPNSTRGLVGMPMLTKAKDLPPIPSVAARWGARRPF